MTVSRESRPSESGVGCTISRSAATMLSHTRVLDTLVTWVAEALAAAPPVGAATAVEVRVSLVVSRATLT